MGTDRSVVSSQTHAPSAAHPGYRTDIDGLRAFAGELGVLFQIVDDILDVTGSEDALGKQQGSDVRLGKRTYVTEFGLDGARRLAGESRERARAALLGTSRAAGDTDGGELGRITDFIATRSY